MSISYYNTVIKPSMFNLDIVLCVIIKEEFKTQLMSAK